MKKILGIVIVASFGGVVLWIGLGIYTATSLPGLNRVKGSYEVDNCEFPRNENAESVCPTLFCEKALLDSAIIPADAWIVVTGEFKNPKEWTHLIGGIIKNSKDDPNEKPRHFQCWMDGDAVIKYDIVNSGNWAGKLQSGEWKI